MRSSTSQGSAYFCDTQPLGNDTSAQESNAPPALKGDGDFRQNALAPKLVPKTSMILCPPGYVYRCNQYGCFCVKA
jgi:hypothetical protein